MALFGPPNVEKMRQNRDVQGLVRTLSYNKGAKANQVRCAAAIALCRLGTCRAIHPARDQVPSAIDEITNPEAAEPLAEALRYVIPNAAEDWILFRHLAKKLSDLREPRTIPALVEAIRTVHAREPIDAAIRALLPFEDQALELLLDALKDPDGIGEIPTALFAFGDLRAVEPLVDTLGELATRGAGEGLLGRHCFAAEREILSVVRALGEIADSRAVPSLLGVLQGSVSFSSRGHDGNHDLQKEIVKALGKIGDESAAPTLISLYNDDRCETNTRVAVIAALGRFPMSSESLTVLEDAIFLSVRCPSSGRWSSDEPVAALKVLKDWGDPVGNVEIAELFVKMRSGHRSVATDALIEIRRRQDVKPEWLKTADAVARS